MICLFFQFLSIEHCLSIRRFLLSLLQFMRKDYDKIVDVYGWNAQYSEILGKNSWKILLAKSINLKIYSVCFQYFFNFFFFPPITISSTISIDNDEGEKLQKSSYYNGINGKYLFGITIVKMMLWHDLEWLRISIEDDRKRPLFWINLEENWMLIFNNERKVISL